MVENGKRHKKGFISDEDISTVLQRYSATTVLALLQELAQVPDEKFNWNAIVKKSSTGISNPREYQMLWRHLAYHTSLVERLDDDEVEPLDDDSDLDYELEALPTVAPEVSAEAVACVKVLIASGMPSNSTLPNGLTVEAPLTISIPSRQPTTAPSESLQPSSLAHGTNITVPVSVQKQLLPAETPAEGLDANVLASGNLPPRRKRKPWSAAEDLELIAAVKKCGEGNWANILKGDFKSERSASQLSQRWNIIRKRKGNSSLGGSSQLSEAQLAARRAVSFALNMPMTDKLKASSSPGGAIKPGNSIHHVAGTSAGIKREPQTEYDFHPTLRQRPETFSHSSKPDIGTLGPTTKQDSVPAVTQRSIVLGLSSKSRVNLNAHSTKPSPGPDELVKATAVAAGARIATPSDAASLLKAAQAKNIVHIMPGGGSKIKASVASGGNTWPSNVHYIRTGLATTLSTYSTAPPNDSRSANQHIQGHSVKPAGAVGNQMPTGPMLNVASETTKVATSNLVIEVETSVLEDMIPAKASDKTNTMRDNGQNQTAFLGNSQQEEGQGGPQEGESGAQDQIKEDQVVSISGDTLLGLIEEDLVKPFSGSDNANLRSSSSLEVPAVNNGSQSINGCSDANDNHSLPNNSGDDDKHVVGICDVSLSMASVI